MNPLQQLKSLGQSVWLDYIRRDLMTSGGLQRLVEEDGVGGITSNPTLFAKALSASEGYDAAIQRILQKSPELDSPALFERIEVADLQMAADVLRPVYDRTQGYDGFVSIEVSPYLAYDAEASITEARRLRAEVNRPNLMVKIPATPEGIPAIEQLIAEGININVTLIFSVSQYEDVAQAYLRGIARNPEPHKVRSVASFFVSRVDVAIDRALEDIGSDQALALRGKAGIANAKLAYRRFRQLFSGAEFEKLQARGVHIQKPLWASTSTKNKAYSDVMYVEGLIAPDTINSMPPETLDAFRDHGRPQIALRQGQDDPADVIAPLIKMGINPHSIGIELTEEGVEKFEKSYDELIQALTAKRKALKKRPAA